MTAHGPVPPVVDEEANGEAELARRIEQLRRRTRKLERQRIAAGPSLDRARLVALDVELCRVEAVRRMLAPGGPVDAHAAHLPGAPSYEPTGPHAESVEIQSRRDVLHGAPGAAQRCNERMVRLHSPQTPRPVPR